MMIFLLNLLHRNWSLNSLKECIWVLTKRLHFLKICLSLQLSFFFILYFSVYLSNHWLEWMSFNVQYFAYSTLTSESYCFSKSLFNDLVNNVKAMTASKEKQFLLLPRFIMVYLMNVLPNPNLIQGSPIQSQSLNNEIFAEMKISKSST